MAVKSCNHEFLTLDIYSPWLPWQPAILACGTLESACHYEILEADV